MEHLILPLFIHRDADEFGRPVANGLDEFGFPTGPIPIEIEVRAAYASLEGRAAIPLQDWLVAPDHLLGCTIEATHTSSYISFTAMASAIPCTLASPTALPYQSFSTDAESASILARADGAVGFVSWSSSASEAMLMACTPQAMPSVNWYSIAAATQVEVLANKARPVFNSYLYHPYGIALFDRDGQAIAFIVPESIEYNKEPNMPGKVRITIPKDHPVVEILDKFVEGYVYKSTVLWQGIVPDRRSIGGQDVILDCLTFEALLSRWRIPRSWGYGGSRLCDAMQSIVEERYATHSKSSSEEFWAAPKENCVVHNYITIPRYVLMGKEAYNETYESSITFTWEFDELVEPYLLRWRMYTNIEYRSFEYIYQVSYDGTTWEEWTCVNIIGNLAKGFHEIATSPQGHEFGKVRGIRVKLQAPYYAGYAPVNLYGIELLTRSESGYKFTHKVDESDAMPGVYKFENTTALEALSSLCSDSGYSLRVTPAKEVIVERPSINSPWVLFVGLDERFGGAEVLEAYTWGEASISNNLIVRGFGDGTGALAIHKKDEASIERYGERPAIASNPMITCTSSQEKIADEILGELAWPRPYMRLRMIVPRKLGRSQVPWPDEVEIGDAVIVYWPGEVRYGDETAEPSELFYVTEERRSWDAAQGEVVELNLARKPAAQDKAVGVTQIPIPVNADKTAVRITLGNVKR